MEGVEVVVAVGWVVVYKDFLLVCDVQGDV